MEIVLHIDEFVFSATVARAKCGVEELNRLLDKRAEDGA